MIPQLINIKTNKALANSPECFYIGRNTQKYLRERGFGNPFSHIPTSIAAVIVNTREESIRAYKDWLLGIRYQDVEPKHRKWILDNLNIIGQYKYLCCFCVPLPCHGEILIELYKEKYGK